MKTIWQEAARREVFDRIEKLSADRPAQWGRMSSQQMVRHLIGSVQIATGELVVKDKRTPLRLPGIKHMVVCYLPFLKNLPTAPELMITSTPNTWTHDIDDLKSTISRFVGRGADARWPPHPAFGRLSGKQWGVLVYRHVDHHLRQFGA